MNTLVAFGGEGASLVAYAAAILLAGLVLRNPKAPTWLRVEFAAQMASLVLVALLMVIVVYAMQGFLSAGLNYPEALFAIVATPIVARYLVWKTFRIGERLKAADAGRSPFERLERAHAHPQFESQPH